MFALGQDVETSEHAEIERKGSALQRTAEFRDQLFDENQWALVKVLGGLALGMYFMYRFLMK